ncbi:hypothetical protein [Steroidobacter gossypii]|uniref:hypothetical protein n=1 Tax=Steroidobacter gossypii TaxID=2805490 RepID=UPI001C3FD06D|nr:hypothetical protein [Steroidobacter gossypii]
MFSRTKDQLLGLPGLCNYRRPRLAPENPSMCKEQLEESQYAKGLFGGGGVGRSVRPVAPARD